MHAKKKNSKGSNLTIKVIKRSVIYTIQWKKSILFPSLSAVLLSNTIPLLGQTDPQENKNNGVRTASHGAGACMGPLKSGAHPLTGAGESSPCAPKALICRLRSWNQPCKSITTLIIQVNRALTTICQDFNQSWSWQPFSLVENLRVSAKGPLGSWISAYMTEACQPMPVAGSCSLLLPTSCSYFSKHR